MDKKLLFVLVMSLGTVLLVQYFGSRPSKDLKIDQVQPGQSYRVSTKEDILKPLNREVDFLDKKIVQNEGLTVVDTDLCKWVFSDFGGVLSSVEYKKRLGISNEPLKTISHKDFFQREESCFLLALSEKTPYFYKFISKKELDDRFELTYQCAIDGNWTINKIYSVYKNSYKLDLVLDFIPNTAVVEPLQPRLFYPAPFVSEVSKNVVSGFVFNSSKNDIVQVSTSEESGSAWPAPEAFGAQDRYFANTLIGDKDHFVGRAYYKKLGDNLFSILEGLSLKEKSTFNLSFYFGPKDLQDMSAVNSRLDGLLNFGWLSWFCKLLLKLLEYLYKFVHNYGLAIILLTFLIKIPFLPLTMKASQVMEDYQKHQPHIARIRQAYKGNPQQMHEEIMKYHKERGISPTAQFIGCLPLLIDLPIIYSLYRVLGNYMDLYNAPFVGWITDLSARDPYFILPVLMGLSMFWQQKLMPMADSKQKIISLFTTIFVVALFANLPAGLVLYWLTKNILTVGETYLRKSIFSK